ncbi:MAG: glycosyltransferase [Mariprofundaceae bacterium]
MRVLFVSHHANLIGGGELSQTELIQSLSLDDHRELFLGIPSDGWCSRQVRSHGVSVLHLPMPEIGVWTTLKTVATWIKSLRGSKKPDLIHANTSRSCFYAGIVGKILRIPVVFHCRIADADPRMDYLLVRLASVIVANSHATAKRFSDWPFLKVHTIYNGIDVPHVRKITEGSRPFDAKSIILTVARVSRWKRHDLLLEAFEKVAEQLPGAHWILLGGEDPEDQAWWSALQHKSMLSQFSDRIHWLGQVDDVFSWYQHADIMVLGSKLEPFGRVLVEAMGSSVPVIAYNAGGPAEIVEHGEHGLLLNDDKVDTLAGAVIQLLTHHELRRKMAISGEVHAKSYSLSLHVDAMRHLFESVLKEKER